MISRHSLIPNGDVTSIFLPRQLHMGENAVEDLGGIAGPLGSRPYVDGSEARR